MNIYEKIKDENINMANIHPWLLQLVDMQSTDEQIFNILKMLHQVNKEQDEHNRRQIILIWLVLWCFFFLFLYSFCYDRRTRRQPRRTRTPRGRMTPSTM